MTSSTVGKAKKILQGSLIGLGVLTLLALFTLTKISENVVRDWALMLVNQGLAPQRLSLSTEEFQLGLFPKPHATLKHASIQNLMTGQYFQLDALKISPSILSLFTGKMGADIYIPMGLGAVDATIAMSNRSFSASVSGNKLELDRILSFAGFPGIKTKGQLSINLSLSGDPLTAPSWNGELTLNGSQLAILPQNIMGIDLPIINISEVKNKVTLTNGKAKIIDGIIGKTGDDIAIQLSGDITLQNRIDESQVNLKALLNLSQKITGSLTLLEAILANAKQPTGGYGYTISGVAIAPIIAPIIGPESQP